MKKQLTENPLSVDGKRIIWLDLVKFVAIFMMIAVHCTDNVTPAERSEPWYNLWGSFYGYRGFTSPCEAKHGFLL